MHLVKYFMVVKNQLLKKHREGDAQQLGALAALPEDTGAVPSTCIVTLTTGCNSSSRVL